MPMATLNAVLPVFLVALVGYIAAKKLKLDVVSISRICLYILVPSLTFHSLSTSKVDLGTAWRLALATFAMPFILWPIFTGLFRLLKWDKDFSQAMLLPSIFTNAGNYGLPVCLFAFGQLGMELGVVFMVTQSALIASLGVYIAASSKMNTKTALRHVLKMPALYAAMLGILFRTFNLKVPLFLARPVELLAQAGISIFLLVLGMQLVNGTKGSLFGPASVVAFLRLVLVPFIMMLVGTLFGLHGLPFKIFVLQAAMPPPVNSTILAQEFDAYPKEVSQATMLGTILSIASLSIWITILAKL